MTARVALGKPRKTTLNVPGPSPNPATNLLFADVVLRGVAILARRGAERAMLGAEYDRKKAHEVMAGKTLGYSIASFTVARLATHSLPGLGIATGLVLGKALFDRAAARGDARTMRQRQLQDMADKVDDAPLP